ncbi:MAG: aminoacyl-tRNA hydrolase [FCB group bacterium]|nr:aminoacyl-tRNA hydrolase [FCB group bacterium]
MNTHNSPLDRLPVRWEFIRSSGPGGQHVNKVATGVQLRLSLDALPLNEAEMNRFRQLAKNRINVDDEVVIKATRFRSQLKNRQDALKRLDSLLSKAREKERPRIATATPRRAIETRIQSKKLKSRKKRLRRKPDLPED